MHPFYVSDVLLAQGRCPWVLANPHHRPLFVMPFLKLSISRSSATHPRLDRYTGHTCAMRVRLNLRLDIVVLIGSNATRAKG